mmetsp:Transcript_2812/g.7267  ORF Transcript_2812/g.7267 Transcript_2812/m.7267 type:complete len:288 (-) Transcript_2812:98-961(-)
MRRRSTARWRRWSTFSQAAPTSARSTTAAAPPSTPRVRTATWASPRPSSTPPPTSTSPTSKGERRCTRRRSTNTRTWLASSSPAALASPRRICAAASRPRSRARSATRRSPSSARATTRPRPRHAPPPTPSSSLANPTPHPPKRATATRRRQRGPWARSARASRSSVPPGNRVPPTGDVRHGLVAAATWRRPGPRRSAGAGGGGATREVQRRRRRLSRAETGGGRTTSATRTLSPGGSSPCKSSRRGAVPGARVDGKGDRGEAMGRRGRWRWSTRAPPHRHRRPREE